METSTTTRVKQMTWETNYNNKMGCQGFIHVDIKPLNIPRRSTIEATEFEIVTQDGSHPPIRVKLLDLLEFKLTELSDILSIASHGISATDLAELYFKRHPNYMSLNTEMAIYYYQKIN